MTMLEWKDLVSPLAVLSATMITQIVTICVVFANNNLSSRRYSREKLWELKKAAYSEILSQVKRVVSAYRTSGMPFPASVSEEEQAEYRRKHAKQAYEAKELFQVLIAEHYLICSKAFLGCVDRGLDSARFLGSKEEYQNETDIGKASRNYKAFAKLFDVLVQQARTELHTGG